MEIRSVPRSIKDQTSILLSNERVSTMLLEGGPREYIDTLAKCKNELDIRRIVPGHGPMGKPEAIDHLIAYLWWLLREVSEAVRLRLTGTAAVEAVTLDKHFLVSRFSPASRLNPLLKNFHRLNVLSTYRALAQERERLEPVKLRSEAAALLG